MKRRKFIRQTSGSVMFASLLPSASLVHSDPPSSGMMGRICIFSKHLQWLNYPELATLAFQMGFSGIDLTVRDGGHVLPEKVQTDLPAAVKAIRDAGLEVPMITTAITDPDDPLTSDILETAGNLGIKVYRTGWFRYVKGPAITEQLKRAHQQLRTLQVINEANNIAASYQNHAGPYIGSSGWDLYRIIEGLDPKWTGVQFDIRHAMVEGPETWPIKLELLAPYINSVDIKDFTWEQRGEVTLTNVPLGSGMVPFDQFVVKLEELRVRADFSIHYEYPLGGAEHGGSELSISKDAFVERVVSDLNYFQEVLARKGYPATEGAL